MNGTGSDALLDESLDDQGELGEMKKHYSSQLVQLKEVFPDWTTDDLVFALQESDGDVAATVDKITGGSVSQFSEVKNPKDRARSKVKEPAAVDKAGHRGGRGRGGTDSTRGGRGRGADRGRGGFRGARGGHATTNGAPQDAATASVPTTESSAWVDTSNATATAGAWDTAVPDTTKDAGGTENSAWSNVVTADATPAAASEGVKSSLIPEGGAKKSWASMFAPKPAQPPAKKAPVSQPPPAELSASDQATIERQIEGGKDVDTAPPPPTIQEPPAEPMVATANVIPPEEPPISTERDELEITPSKVPLTEENVEYLPDDSKPPATQTAASTAGSNDPRNLTPLPGQQAPIGRPPMGGYATSASRATGQAGRSASYQRRVQEQQEAVVMPGHNAVDRAAVQFGSMGLNGELGPDVDDDREEPETRQAPQHSPPAQPRTSLPPAPRQKAALQEPILPESLPTPKQAPGLPPASIQNQQMQDALPSGMPNEPAQMNQSYAQYGRYAQPGMQQDPAPQQKQYDPFSHQAQQSQFDQYAAHSQQAPPQQQSQSGFGGLSSAPNDYSQYYTTDQQRQSYNSYYGNTYGPQDVRSQLAPGQHAAELGQQRSGSGFGAGPNDSAFSSQAQQQVSIPPTPLLELNDALNNCNNEDERQHILKEIQRIVSQAQPHITKTQSPFNKHATVYEGAAGRERARESPFQGSLQPSLQPFTDVTNHMPRNTPSVHYSKANISNIPTKQAQSRYVDTTGSGHNTPNPIMGSQQQGGPNTQQAQHSVHQTGHHHQGGYNASPYGHPYYGNPYQGAYNNQYGYNNQVSGYGGGYPAKHSGMYAGSHGYSMGPQSSYDQHSASPANAVSYAQNQQTSMRSASGMSAGLGNLDDYGRASAQSGGHQQSGGFGSMNDNFPRSTSGFGGPSAYGQQSMAQQDDSLKPYADSKGGPSPALGQPGGRPGSAANSAGGSAQAGLPPPQSHQSGFGAYGSFPGQGGYGGLGGLGNQQQQQHGQNTMGGQGGYGNYGSSGFSQYNSYGSRGGTGWGSNYGH